MNTDLMFSSKTDLWSTPQNFFDKLNREFRFTLDVCALPENSKCEKFYSPDIDGLKQEWGGVCGATRRMAEGSPNGSKKVLNPRKMELLLFALCFYRQGQTRDGFMSIFTKKPRLDL